MFTLIITLNRKNYLRTLDTYRRTLLKLSDHAKKGKFGLLNLKPKKETDYNTPNEYSLNFDCVIKPFNYSEVRQHYLDEYYKFCEVLIENYSKLGINLQKSKLPKLE